MYGVVLWSNPNENKAVIWCEDHGDLAFYRSSVQGQDMMLDAGDFVQFDVTIEQKCRYADGVRLIEDGLYKGITDGLNSQKASAPTCRQARVQPRTSASILPFAKRPVDTRSQDAPASAAGF